MKIGPVLAAGAMVSARIAWEDSDRPAFDLRFSFSSDDVPAADPNAFLIAVFVSALRARERRIAVEGAVCPVLRDGLRGAAAVLGRWYGAGPMPAIDPTRGFRAGLPPAGGGEAIFVSGGLDSLDLLLSRGRGLPREHPAAVRRGIFIQRLGLFPEEAQIAEIDARSERAARGIAAAEGLPLAIVSTNILELQDEMRSFSLESHGSLFAAIAQLLAGRFATTALAASDDVASGLGPWGSHPLLDPLFSTSAMRFVHDGIGLTREEKAERVGRSLPARRHLFACSFPVPGDPLLNCGRCEKCLRTMMELLVAGALAESEVFPTDLSAEAIRALPGVPPYRRLDYYWKTLPAAARRVGRPDLAGAIEERLEENRRAEDWEADRGWTGVLRRADRRWLGGRALAVRRRIAAAASPPR